MKKGMECELVSRISYIVYSEENRSQNPNSYLVFLRTAYSVERVASRRYRDE